MTRINLQSAEDGMKHFFELLELILNACNDKLDRFVEGDTISLKDTELEEYSDKFHEMLEEFATLCINSEAEGVLKKLEELRDRVEIDKFIQWLSGYAENILEPYNELEFVRTMDLDKFSRISRYCFYNFVLVESGRENIDDKICEESQLIIFRKLIFTIADLVIVHNYNKENINNRVLSDFKLREEQISILWNLIEENRDEMWKVMLMRKLCRVEQKLDALLVE